MGEKPYRPMGRSSTVTIDEKLAALQEEIIQIKKAVNILSVHLFRKKAL